MNQNPYEPPPLSAPGKGSDVDGANPVLVCAAIIGVCLAILIIHTALTYPVVRPPDWEKELGFIVRVSVAKWGSLATVIVSSASYFHSERCRLNNLLYTFSMSPVIVVLLLYVSWLIIFA